MQAHTSKQGICRHSYQLWSVSHRCVPSSAALLIGHKRKCTTTILYFRSSVFGMDPARDEWSAREFFVWMFIFAPCALGLEATCDALALVATTVGLINLTLSTRMRFNYLGWEAFPLNLSGQYIQA